MNTIAIVFSMVVLSLPLSSEAGSVVCKYDAFGQLSYYSRLDGVLLSYTYDGCKNRKTLMVENEPGTPDCSGSIVLLENLVFPSGIECICEATQSITAGAGVVIPRGARVIFKSPVILFKNGFRVEEGADFRTMH
ncbi:MAG: hypothetical protein V1793_13630 [Pseudomonadota bacterium]